VLLVSLWYDQTFYVIFVIISLFRLYFYLYVQVPNQLPKQLIFCKIVLNKIQTVDSLQVVQISIFVINGLNCLKL